MDSTFSITNASPTLFRAVRIDTYTSLAMRRFVLRFGLFLHLFSLVSIGLMIFIRASAHTFLGGLLPFFAFFNWFFVWGFFFIAASFFYAVLFFEFFYVASSRSIRVGEKEGKDIVLLFDGAAIFYNLDLLRLRGSFSLFDAYVLLARDEFFSAALLRLGVFDFAVFLSTHGDALRAIAIDKKAFMERMVGTNKQEEEKIALGDASFVLALYDIDERFRSFLFEKRIGREELEGVSEWIGKSMETRRAKSFLWDRAELGRTPGVAKDFGFGQTFTLDMHSHDVRGDLHPLTLLSRKRSIDMVEDILSKSGEANILLVGKEGVGKETVLEGLAARIYRGTAPPMLEYKRMVRLDIDSIIALSKTKGAFEEIMLRIVKETMSAGNIILVLSDLPYLIESAQKIGSDFISIAESAMAGSKLQIIALSDPYGYHRVLEPQGKIQALFSKVDVNELDGKETVGILEEVVPVLEYKTNAIFSYQALIRIAEIASRFIQTGAMPEKAINLADEVITVMKQNATGMIMPADVDVFASQKLKIPLGEAETEEKDILLRFEELLHERIINQKEAIQTISDTMRRARAGVRNEKRPIGSFLFLGPTGVGKTESAKALATVYFKGEDRMIRFDMSEFQGEEGIKKMIGAFGLSEPGMLASRVRDNPFALYLFDEIEKSSREVLNLFLQILEEGFFSDGRGERISMRETIMIATSNASASLIWKLVQEGKDPSLVKKEVIDSIQKSGIISPELLNRFDGIVIFHPLDESQLGEVARLLLKELQARLKEKDITLEISDELVKKVVEVGYNQTFGARPMRRAIADRVESYLAKKILAGELKRGDTVTFNTEEVSRL